MKTLEEARRILFGHFAYSGASDVETIPSTDAVDRILAEGVSARLSSPNFHAAAMDGIAVRAEDTFGANENRPKRFTIGKDAFYVNTGHAIPENTNAVIMIENIQEAENGEIVIEAPAFPWQHIRKMGEDIVATELLFPQNHRITPYCIGALLSGGLFDVKVKKKPKLLMIPTGSELVDWRHAAPDLLKPGQAIETNSFVLGKIAETCGGTFQRREIIVDDPEKIEKAVQEAVESDIDMVLLVGGSSAGSEDYTREVIDKLGEVLVHGVTMMPGKPVVIGKIKNKPIFGIPGYPVSAIIAFEQFVQPLIYRYLGQTEKQREVVFARPSRKIPSKLGVEEFLRVKLGEVGDTIVATPLPRGAGCITTITEADGIIRIPTHIEGLREDETATVELLNPLPAVQNTIVVVGSHDNTLDVLADCIRSKHGHLTVSSSHVGSMGGLMAIKRGVCHLAGSHLLDVQDGSYNLSYIRRYLEGIPVKLVHLVMRDQGLMILGGNPKKIDDIADLVREDVRFINRQGGSGTRILLDYQLNKLGIDPANINGYETEEYTHMSVAAAVISGAADVGLGINAAARALGLDFIPVVTEQYDLVIPEPYFETEKIQILLETIQSDDFKKRVEALGGYSTQNTGRIIV